MENTIGNRIAMLRKEKGLKQDYLAEVLGVSPQAVSKWENDQTCPDISILPELAKILNVSIDELLTGKKEVKPVVQMLPEEKRKNINELMLKIVITSNENDKVKINLPIALVEAGIEMGLSLSDVTDKKSLKEIDLEKIFELVKKGAIGNLVEIESADGDIINIFVE